MLFVLWKARSLQIQLSRVDGKRQLSSKKRGAGTRVITFPQPAASGVSLNVSLDWGNQHHKLQAFLDSGAAGNFMDFTLARHLRIQPITLQEPLTITALDGRPLGSGQVRQCTTPLHLQIGCHKERIQFFLIHSPEFPLILGFPWLSLHNPHIQPKIRKSWDSMENANKKKKVVISKFTLTCISLQTI